MTLSQPCSLTGCDRRGRWVPWVIIPLDDGRTPLELAFGLQVCDRHKATIEVDDLVVPNLWRDMRAEAKARGRGNIIQDDAKVVMKGVG